MPDDTNDAPEKETLEVIEPATEESTEVNPETDKAVGGAEASREEPTEVVDQDTPKKHKRRFFHRPTKKQLIIATSALAVILLLGLIPVTRNIVFGTVFKTNLSVEAYDESATTTGQTGRVQLTDLTIKVDGQQKATQATSPVLLTKLSPGSHHIEISKSNYKTVQQTVKTNLALGKQHNSLSTKLEATGIPTKYKVLNYITNDPVQGVVVSAGDSKATTDEKGIALVILPIQKEKIYILKLSGDGYVAKTTDVTLGKETELSIVPAGKVYFLSKASGKVDVVKTNLDGSDRSTVLAGTGKEVDGSTTMISTTDWKYLALNTHREDKKSQIILINTTDDTQTTIDEGNADFTLYGWDKSKLVFTSSNNDTAVWTSGKYKLKSYDAEQKKLSILYQNVASGSNSSDEKYEVFDFISIVNHRVLFGTNNYGNNTSGLANSVYLVPISSGDKKSLFSYGNSESNMDLTYTSANEAYLSSYRYSDGKSLYYKVDEDGNWKNLDKLPDNTTQYTYFSSPDAKQLLWSEERDGKQTVLLGDYEAKNTNKLYSLSELKPYAWFTNNYALYSKKDSELYIASIKPDSTPKKISDYHRPANVTFRGYGGGGGGPY